MRYLLQATHTYLYYSAAKHTHTYTHPNTTPHTPYTLTLTKGGQTLDHIKHVLHCSKFPRRFNPNTAFLNCTEQNVTFCRKALLGSKHPVNLEPCTTSFIRSRIIPPAISGEVTNCYYLGKQVQKVVKCTQLLLLIAIHTRRLTTGTITAWRLGYN